jgi:small subunit ribosomal protein S15
LAAKVRIKAEIYTQKLKYLAQTFGLYPDNVYLCSLKDSILYIFKTVIMYLDAAKKQEIFGKYGKSNTDTGSAEAQIALFSYRINHLTEHMKLNRKDYSTERALTMLVGKRRRLLDYLKSKDIERYRAIIKSLGLRK